MTTTFDRREKNPGKNKMVTTIKKEEKLQLLLQSVTKLVYGDSLFL